MAAAPELQAARTPRIVWIELTSKCPFDCVFCSRKTRRGAGQHLRFDVYSALLAALVEPRKLILNYSGESTVYPDLIPAIRRARATGAFVEMVSALGSAPESLLGPLSRSGLNRLTVSLHAADPETFAAIYRHSSFAAVRSRLGRFLELGRETGAAPIVDLAFVAMDSNLAQLFGVAALASEFGLRDITIFPVLRRDEIPVQFPVELVPSGARRPEFLARVQAEVERTARQHPEIRLTISGEQPARAGERLGEVPIPWPHELPPGALIHSCDQNPWETAHVLANGDVVACEVLDKYPLGNLTVQSIGEIWRGPAYQSFRERYRRGQVPECRACPWKRAYLPGPRSSEIIASRGLSAQLLYGWHDPAGEEHVWSSQQSAAVLDPRPNSRTVHVAGILPPGPEGVCNCLTISLHGIELGRVSNPTRENLVFGADFAVPQPQPAPWIIEFRTSHTCRPAERHAGADQRDLGFALSLLASKEFVDPGRASRQEALLRPLRRFVRAVDRAGTMLPRRGHARRMSSLAWAPGLTVLIPEWDNLAELEACLASVRQAAREWKEPLQVVVVVNGSPERCYDALRRDHPEARWRFYARPLGFSGAIRAGLEVVQDDWVYLLNSDVVLDPSAFSALAGLRSDGVFSIASQILLKDTTRFRDETNWTALLVESGLATIHDWIPTSDAPVPTFYAGGGASLFRTRLLRKFLDAAVYDPFYWEDVEWGWRARKLGFESWFCPASRAHHTRRGTIARHYSADEVESIVRRNALLFQLRNFTATGSLDQAIAEIARAPERIAAHFLAPATRWSIARGRLWNHIAPFTDAEVFARWRQSISSGSSAPPLARAGAPRFAAAPV